MKRTLSSPVASGRDTSRQRTSDQVSQQASAASLVAAWTRALGGTGSLDDVAAWERFAVLTPYDPDAAYKIAERIGSPVEDVVTLTYEPAWARIAALPNLGTWLDDHIRPSHERMTLPSFVDLIDAAQRVVANDSRVSLSRIVDDLASVDNGIRYQASADLVNMLDTALRRQATISVLGQGSIAPDYPPALPRSLWGQAVNALAAQPGTCNPQSLYYIMVSEVGPHPAGATNGLPEEGTYAFVFRPFGGAREPGVHGAFAPNVPSDETPAFDLQSWDSGLPMPNATVSAFLSALARARPRGPYRTDNLSGVAQVRNALVPLYDLNDLPEPVYATFEDQAASGDDWWAAPIDRLAGVWLSECELVAAVTAFAGQLEARRNAPLFDAVPSTLFDAVVDAVAGGAGASGDEAMRVDLLRGVVPRDTVERMLPRLWFKACSADPDAPSGVLGGAGALAAAVNAIGTPVTDAQAARPELLCAALAQRAVEDQLRERYRDFMPPTLHSDDPLWPGLAIDDDISQTAPDNPFVFS